MLIDPRTFRRLVSAAAILEDETHDAATVRAIATQLRLSPFQMIRQFAALYGTTPHQYRTQARLLRAKALLAKGATVTDVCMEVGFTSLGSFSALFTRWVGASPTRYRRSIQVPRAFAPQIVPGCFGLFVAQFSRSTAA